MRKIIISMAIAITAGLVTTATAQTQVKNNAQQQEKKQATTAQSSVKKNAQQQTATKQAVSNTANKQTRSVTSDEEKKQMEEKVRKHQAEIGEYEKKVEQRKKANLEYE